jgi:predicted small lipoprotein YifL
MKNLTNNILQVLAAILLVFSLSNCGDDEPVEPPNEEELITTVNVTFSPTAGSAVTMKFYDADGEDGPTNPVITGGSLISNTEYSVSLELLNESETPSEDVTEEIEEEDEDHQFFFQVSAALKLTHSYDDQDGNGNPVGLTNKITTGASSSGTLTLTLRHEADKSASGVAAGDITNAGGETDIEVTFDVTIAD